MNVFEQERKGYAYNNADSLEHVIGANKPETTAIKNTNNESKTACLPSYTAKSMTKEEALQAMKEGKKVTHKYFSNDEFMELTIGGNYKFEDGNIATPQNFWAHRSESFWNNGWRIFAV